MLSYMSLNGGGIAAAYVPFNIIMWPKSKRPIWCEKIFGQRTTGAYKASHLGGWYASTPTRETFSDFIKDDNGSAAISYNTVIKELISILSHWYVPFISVQYSTSKPNLLSHTYFLHFPLTEHPQYFIFSAFPHLSFLIFYSLSLKCEPRSAGMWLWGPFSKSASWHNGINKFPAI